MNSKHVVMRMIAAVLMILALTATVAVAQEERPMAIEPLSSGGGEVGFDHLHEVESNDTFALADEMWRGSIMMGEIPSGGDVDTFWFEGWEDDHIIADIGGSHPDTIVRLYDSSYTEIAMNDDFDGLDSRLHFTLPETDTYYLTVESYAGAYEGPYELLLDTVTYVSVKGKVKLDGVKYAQDDILTFYDWAHVWDVLFDASKHGLKQKENLADFAIMSNGDLLLTFMGTTWVPGLGNVNAQDIVLYDDNEYRLYFDGSDVGLTRRAETIDSLSVDSSGNLIIGITGRGNVPGIADKVEDEDLLLFSPTSLFEDTQGTWSWFFDGSAEDLDSVDLLGVWFDASHIYADLYLSVSKRAPVGDSESDTVIEKGDFEACYFRGTASAPDCFWGIGTGFGGTYAGLQEKAVDGAAKGISPWPATAAGSMMRPTDK